VNSAHPLWLRETAALRTRRLRVVGDDIVLDSVRADAIELGMDIVDDPAADVDIAVVPLSEAAAGAEAHADELAAVHLGDEDFALVRTASRTVVAYGGAQGGLYGWFQVRRDARADAAAATAGMAVHRPEHELRMLDHWDNVDVHPHMGQVERGYSGGSLFYEAGRVREDLTRVVEYARHLASIGVNRVALNNVNVGRREARLLTDDLGEVARLAAAFRPWGIRVHLSVGFGSPQRLGGLGTSDPLDEGVQRWWADAADAVYAAIPDFGGFLVKADSEGQAGPFAYGRDHADGANMLARALAPHGGIVHWRAFVYNHRQDWRDRTTDRARAAYDTFAPLDGRFDDNVVLQVKYGPLDFQTREPVSPVIAAMTRTRVAVELQVTQEYTGHQLHAVYLAPLWREILDFRPFGGDGPRVAEIAGGGMAAVSNIGDDVFWTGHPLAQANLYAYGRLAWDSTLEPEAILDEWIAQTFPDDAEVAGGLHRMLDDSWLTYESYTAPLGVCFMVDPLRGHYGPSVDGYEYSAWGTYHFADRDGVGVDRTSATGTGYAGQYPEPWARTYESLESVPDELLLFFHHVPYTHRLHSGSTVIQHIYDTHFAGVSKVERMRADWDAIADLIEPATAERIAERLDEQLRSAIEWRDQINTYFWRKSGVPDERGRPIY
jgi:alpha-glucuronidase